MSHTVWRCFKCGSLHVDEIVSRRDQFRIGGHRMCCITSFAISTKRGGS